MASCVDEFPNELELNTSRKFDNRICVCVLKSKLWFKGLIRTILRGNRPSFLRVIELWKYIVEYNKYYSINMNIMFDEYFKPKSKSYNLILMKSLSLFIF